MKIQNDHVSVNEWNAVVYIIVITLVKRKIMILNIRYQIEVTVRSARMIMLMILNLQQ